MPIRGMMAPESDMTKQKPLKERLHKKVASFDRDASARLWESLGELVASLSADERQFIDGIAGCSPFLSRIMMRHPSVVIDLLNTAPEVALDQLLTSAKSFDPKESQEALMRRLRVYKDQASLLIAFADIAGAWDVMAATAAISRFADAVIDTALTAGAHMAGLDNTKGIAVLAMGKLGAWELNYSSDVDLIVLYDPEQMRGVKPVEAKAVAIRAAKEMVNILQAQTGDGYVFRTDLRLRPDPGVSALAVSVTAAESYYQSFGQNWERMAYIKARPCAGDIKLGETFLGWLRPFIWRKFLDYAAIEDVKNVKRQIHSAKGGHEIEFAGHDVKVGRGGIREIEFFAQTQQIIVGGKRPEVRQRETLVALDALVAEKAVTEKQRDDLAAAYRFLRHIEHRLQMVNDEQTHKLPKSDDDINRLAVFAGEGDAVTLEKRLIETFTLVSHHFDSLFAASAPKKKVDGSLVFTGVDADPKTIETLTALGFSRAEEVSAIIRKWHAGGIRATRTERSRHILTDMMEPLLGALSKASEPDAAFFAFADFLQHLPAGVQIFSLLSNNIKLFDTLIDIITLSPQLATTLSRHRNLVESLLEYGVLGGIYPLQDYCVELSNLGIDDDFEGGLNGLRRWAGERRFHVTAAVAIDALSAREAAAHFTAIAEAVIDFAIPLALRETERQFGTLEGGELAVVAFGRLGAAEMTAMSDLDLVFVYDALANSMATGRQGLSASEYYSRVVRRIVTALSALTEEGGLYEVDMQLRPSGGAGPTAVSFNSFSKYYQQDAWTWEIDGANEGPTCARRRQACERDQ